MLVADDAGLPGRGCMVRPAPVLRFHPNGAAVTDARQPTARPAPAFPIEDALMASRWAEQVAPLGYRVVITPCYAQAEEVIEVYVPRARAPAFRAHRGAASILVRDCVGLTLSFPTLADALLAMAPLPKPGRRAMLRGGSPAWLPTPSGPRGSAWSRAGRSVSSILALMVGSSRD